MIIEHEPISNNNQPISEETSKQDSLEGRRRWGFVALVAGPVITLALLTGACNDGGLGPHNVPFVNVDWIEDTNGNGSLIDEVRQEKGIEWLPGLDMDGQREDKDGKQDPEGHFMISKKDVALVENSVCTWPVDPKYDIDGNGHVTVEDVAIVEKHVGEEVSEDPKPNMRLDKLWLRNGISLEPTGRDPICEKDLQVP